MRPDDGTARLAPEDRGLSVPDVELWVEDGSERGKSARLAEGFLRIGSAKGNELQLADATVSRFHCEISRRADVVSVKDCQSTNGTFVNGVRVIEAFLSSGDQLRVGNTTLRVAGNAEPVTVALSARDHFGELLGGSVEMRRLYARLERTAHTDATVLITGETGTGKELVAQELHRQSLRRGGPFVAVDCAAVPEQLFESELFGHVRGAFTSASTDRKGAFEQADGGTLFFDELAELPLSLQVKLLRVLETREVRRVGAEKARSVDVRVLAATNSSLEEAVNAGRFREDLYFRLAVVSVELPPLSRRREDIPALVDHFHRLFTGSDDPAPRDLTDAATRRAWPGNVRELRNFVQRSLFLGWEEAQSPSVAESGDGARVPVHLPLKEARFVWLDMFEREYLKEMLARTNGNVTRAAELAGVNRRLLHRMLARAGFSSRDFSG